MKFAQVFIISLVVCALCILAVEAGHHRPYPRPHPRPHPSQQGNIDCNCNVSDSNNNSTDNSTTVVVCDCSGDNDAPGSGYYNCAVDTSNYNNNNSSNNSSNSSNSTNNSYGSYSSYSGCNSGNSNAVNTTCYDTRSNNSSTYQCTMYGVNSKNISGHYTINCSNGTANNNTNNNNGTNNNGTNNNAQTYNCTLASNHTVDGNVAFDCSNAQSAPGSKFYDCNLFNFANGTLNFNCSDNSTSHASYDCFAYNISAATQVLKLNGTYQVSCMTASGDNNNSTAPDPQTNVNQAFDGFRLSAWKQLFGRLF